MASIHHPAPATNSASVSTAASSAEESFSTRLQQDLSNDGRLESITAPIPSQALSDSLRRPAPVAPEELISPMESLLRRCFLLLSPEEQGGRPASLSTAFEFKEVSLTSKSLAVNGHSLSVEMGK
jgi:hypothetical protein